MMALPIFPLRRILRRVLFLLPLMLLFLFAEKMGWLNEFNDKLVTHQIDWTNDHQVVNYARAYAIEHSLTKLPDRCLLVVVNGDDPPYAQRMKIYQKRVSGCPSLQRGTELLFTMRVDRINKMITTDANSPNVFHTLP